MDDPVRSGNAAAVEERLVGFCVATAVAEAPAVDEPIRSGEGAAVQEPKAVVAASQAGPDPGAQEPGITAVGADETVAVGELAVFEIPPVRVSVDGTLAGGNAGKPAAVDDVPTCGASTIDGTLAGGNAGRPAAVDVPTCGAAAIEGPAEIDEIKPQSKEKVTRNTVLVCRTVNYVNI